MSITTILETLLIGPLKLIFEVIFTLANKLIGHPGLAIIVLSLTMNILVLPLYKRADAMQEEARDMDAKLRDGVAHIKKTFSGDERMMILQTYYQQNRYSPLSALNGSVSLLLEIPFFMAAYQFLSHLDILNGVSLGPIADLGAPDGLLVIGGLTVNLLPVAMTVINVISSAIYLKGFPLKTKIQLYAMALFFLVFLYTSPSCLVFYWTLNNVFSLVKTIFYKLKNPGKVIRILSASAGLFLLGFVCFFYGNASASRKLFLALLGCALVLPGLLPLLRKYIPATGKSISATRGQFIMGAIFLTVLVGLLIPSTFIAASPQEYVDINYFHNPTLYLVSSGCLAGGTFLVWLGVFYWLADNRGKNLFTCMVWILSGLMLINYMFFGTDLGIITSTLQYEKGLAFSGQEKILNLAVLLAAGIGLYFIFRKWNRAVITILLTATIALGGMSFVNVGKINRSVDEIAHHQSTESAQMPSFQLSKNGKNVVVLMIDRALGEYIPYLFQEKPELQDQFEGFTYYSNTISFGGFTNFGVPALLGGYEYTPVEMNRRSTESLVDKHNEALKVMPVVFAKNDYRVTVCDPTYANYQWIPDLSIYDDYPEITTYITKGKFGDPAGKEQIISSNHRNFFCFAVMKTMPLFAQPAIYGQGQYNQAVSYTGDPVYSTQKVHDIYKSSGISAAFMEPYNVLVNLPYMTRVTEDGANTFLYLSNDAAHEPMMLQMPFYEPSMQVDNTAYYSESTNSHTVNGKTLIMETDRQLIHYQSNMAVMIQLGKWFDYLRQQDVFDNTRIIIVSDHGQHLAHLDELILDDSSSLYDVELYYPLLMVKDFESTSYTTSDEFMTNADVPTLAFSGLIENPVNPFTGKPITNSEKYAHDQFIIMSWDWDVLENNGNTFLPAKWGSVHDDIWNSENWSFYSGNMVLNEHNVPNR